MAAIAPALTMGLVRPSGLRSMASSELKGRPVLFAPEPVVCGVRPDGVADEGEDERLGDAHDRELVGGVADVEDVPGDAGNAEAEQVRRDARESGVDGRVFAVVILADSARRRPRPDAG